MSTLPSKAKVVIIGGGIHGLSTAWKLSETYKNPGDIVVLEKKDIAAGASGIACGVVRNNYFQPAMRELMAHSVSVWEICVCSMVVTPPFNVKAMCGKSLLSW